MWVILVSDYNWNLHVYSYFNNIQESQIWLQSPTCNDKNISVKQNKNYALLRRKFLFYFTVNEYIHIKAACYSKCNRKMISNLFDFSHNNNNSEKKLESSTVCVSNYVCVLKSNNIKRFDNNLSLLFINTVLWSYVIF